jgi:hypothetical protein
MRAITASVTPAAPQAMVRLDNYATAVLGGQVVVSGGAEFALVHSCDDPCDLVSPVPVANMFWDDSLVPPAIQAGDVSGSFQVMACPLYFRLTLTNGVGAARATFLQVGEHSHSNITQGPFAPPRVAGEGVEGSNYGAMPK